MKWILVSAAAFGLATATPALASAANDTSAHADRAPVQLAQNRDHGKRDHDMNEDRTRDRTHKSAPTPMHKAAPARKAAPVMRKMEHHEAQQQRYDWGKYRQGKAPPVMKTRERFDIHSWQRNFRAEKRYHWKPYRKPHGWYYRRWVFGMILPSLFWNQDYWIADYNNYGLPNPPYGYVWVRYGDDALLVNVRSGYILQVVYGLFD